MKRIELMLLFLFVIGSANAQNSPYVSKVWVADNGNGTYKNPVIHADYSDPDAIRVGEDYYLVASSFDAVPGLPILHSKDLVNWTLIGHALVRQLPFDHFSKTQHGNGVWAPAIRYHNNEFCIYYPDPDFGIYLTKAKNITGPWSQPELVEAGKGLIDPCPFWDEDGKAYLVHAFAGSRAGIKSVLIIKKMDPAGTRVLDPGVLVYDGHDTDPTIEGPKLYKRNGYYYLFAPAGGVSTGWQLVLRSKNIYGPYERKVVIDQGTGSVNGPHQGAWVNTVSGSDWFLHFQDLEAYGRVVHLQPVQWKNDWPVIGIDKDGDGKGEPVMMYTKPVVSRSATPASPAESDEFNALLPGLQWQWQANPKPTWSFCTGSTLRLYANKAPDSTKNLWDLPNILMQKFPAEEFTATVKMQFKPRLKEERAGMVIMGTDYAGLTLVNKEDGIYLEYINCLQADKGKAETTLWSVKLDPSTRPLFLRVSVNKGAVCSFSYGFDENTFTFLPQTFTAKPGRWIGAKMGLFCSRVTTTNDSGFAEFDWFRVTQ